MTPCCMLQFKYTCSVMATSSSCDNELYFGVGIEDEFHNKSSGFACACTQESLANYNNYIGL